MPEGISECSECGVPVASFGGSICDYCTFYTALKSPRLAVWLNTHGLWPIAIVTWRWVDWQLDRRRGAQRERAS